MPTKVKSVFQSRESEETKSLTIKLPVSLYTEIQQLREEVARQAPQLLFNASAICGEALRQAVRQARQELAAMKAAPPAPAAVTEEQP